MEIRAAQVVLACAELEPTLRFFVDELGFRIEAIYPADGPTTAVVSGHGLRLQLERGREPAPGVIRLLVEDAAAIAAGQRERTAPNGTRILIGEAAPVVAPPPVARSFVLTRHDAANGWGTGRAGMLYRDLIPDRQGGSFIASHIRIPDGGPVPDYVHFHRVRFQMIYCHRGWARVVYEDQGPPFVLQAGDCVLQPPEIRHRVLESSQGLEVIEIGHPAAHETLADHGLALPTERLAPERVFGGQRFVRHESARAAWGPFRLPGFECRDTGIADATRGLASVQVARPAAGSATGRWTHDAEFLFGFVLSGRLQLQRGDEDDAQELESGDAWVLPRGEAFGFGESSADLQLLEVALPAGFETRPV